MLVRFAIESQREGLGFSSRGVVCSVCSGRGSSELATLLALSANTTPLRCMPARQVRKLGGKQAAHPPLVEEVVQHELNMPHQDAPVAPPSLA